ncbi:DNA-binding CsgD family transcriptional regulator [Pseudomonas sp. Y3 TE3536]|jgi:DNA-binding CsgD family transcriptional regulator|nr:putative regulatory protein [uncultured Gammaproteobacteria bacterium]
MATLLRGINVDRVAELVWLLAESQGRPDIRARSLQAVAALLEAEHVASFVWDQHEHRSTQPVAFNIDGHHLQAYEQHFHRVDVVTPVMRKVRQAARVDCHVPRATLVASEFYNDFLRPADMEHGLNVFFFDGNQDVADLRIWRGRGRVPFSEREEQLLLTLEPYFLKAFCTVPKQRQALSLREAEVVRLVAGGASDKEVARALGISFTTVRTHLKNAMAKLDCRNRTQLARCV